MTRPEPIGAGSLKLMMAAPSSEEIGDRIAAELALRIRAEDIRRFGDAFVVYAEAEPSELRDWLAGALPADISVLVVEFERWSSRGEGADRGWLLRRGH